MTQRSPSTHHPLRVVALVAAATALVVSATMSVSYARPFGTAGYGGYGASIVADGN